ncbi:MAG TPA: hypothetical protein VKZ63_10000 [Kofleriaceae bacterium]|nr:hypothetical protein [Kofleriaceae bacterium]
MKRTNAAAKETKRRLEVRKQTLRTLQTDELAEVVGGTRLSDITAIQQSRYCI